MLSVLLYSILSVQIVYSVQLNCIDSNYKEIECLILIVLQHKIYGTNSVQNVQTATELYLR